MTSVEEEDDENPFTFESWLQTKKQNPNDPLTTTNNPTSSSKLSLSFDDSDFEFDLKPASQQKNKVITNPPKPSTNKTSVSTKKVTLLSAFFENSPPPSPPPPRPPAPNSSLFPLPPLSPPPSPPTSPRSSQPSINFEIQTKKTKVKIVDNAIPGFPSHSENHFTLSSPNLGSSISPVSSDIPNVNFEIQTKKTKSKPPTSTETVPSLPTTLSTVNTNSVPSTRQNTTKNTPQTRPVNSTNRTTKPPPSSSLPSPNDGELETLRTELYNTKKENDVLNQKLKQLERNYEALKKKEAKEAEELEQMMLAVESNLKLATERALKAEKELSLLLSSNCNITHQTKTELENQIKIQFQTQIDSTQAENQRLVAENQQLLERLRYTTYLGYLFFFLFNFRHNQILKTILIGRSMSHQLTDISTQASTQLQQMLNVGIPALKDIAAVFSELDRTHPVGQ